jgi:hypothetical protein
VIPFDWVEASSQPDAQPRVHVGTFDACVEAKFVTRDHL